MRKTFLKTFAFIALLLPVAAFAVTTGVPSIPHQFFGNVRYENGNPAANGIVIEVKVGSVIVGRSVTVGGKYGVSPSVLLAVKSGGDWSGDVGKFFANGSDTGKTYALARGGYTKIDLTLPNPVVFETTSQNSGGGGGGGGGSSSLTSAPLLAVAKKADIDGDGKVGLFDFNSLMINWGKSGIGFSGDIDGNGKVDIFDFNLLMVEWGVR